MSFSEINQLRKSGRLRDAWNMAQSDLNQNSEDIWTRRAMAWVLYDYAKQNSTFDHFQQFLRCLDQINNLAIPSEENLFWEKTAWLVRGAFATIQRNKAHTAPQFTQLFEAIRSMPFPKPSESWSALLQTALRLKTEWILFPDYCKWWDFSNLRPDDYQPTASADGRRILSLAERAFMAYSKSILTQKRDAEMILWEPTLDHLAKQNPLFIYLPYYLAKIRICINKSQMVFETMTNFARKKKDQFWVWELLGDVAENPESQFCLYCKAMTCRAKDEMIVNLREKMVYLLVKNKHFPQAHGELDHLIATRQRNKWAISTTLLHLQQTEWYTAYKPDNNLQNFYAPFARQGEKTVLGESRKETQTITGQLKKSKTGIGFVDSAFIPPHIANNYNEGDTITIVAVKSFDNKKKRWGWKAIKVLQPS